MSTFYTRLWSVRPEHVESDAELARYLKIRPENISRWKTGRYSPSVTTIEKIARQLNISAGWLAYGEGSKEEKKR